MADIYAEVPNPMPEGYACYQLPAVSSGLDDFYGWKMVPQKEVDLGVKDEDGNTILSRVDDTDGVVVYDATTQSQRSHDETKEMLGQVLQLLASKGGM